MIRIIDAFSRISKLKAVHPIEKIILCILPIIFLNFSRSIFPLILNILFFLVLHIKFKNPLSIVRNFILGLMSFSLISSIPIYFDYGLAYCILINLKAASAGMSFSFLVLTTPLDDILYLFSKYELLRDICDVTKSLERFLILIEDEYMILYHSIKARGGFDSFSLKIKNTGKMAGLLFVNTMKRWKDIKDGIDSRGYKGYTCYLSRDFKHSFTRFLFICAYNIFIIGYVLKYYRT